MKSEYSFEVRGCEIDSFNHVNNAVYLNYLEAARWCFFNDTGMLNYMLSDSIYAVVTDINIRYVRELKVFDKAIVKSEWKPDGEHIVADQNIYIEGSNKRIVKATVRMILVSKDRLVQSIPDNIRNKLNSKDII